MNRRVKGGKVHRERKHKALTVDKYLCGLFVFTAIANDRRTSKPVTCLNCKRAMGKRGGV